MTPNITQISQPAMGAYFAGANAISAINTIKSVTMSHEAEVSGKQTLSGYSGRAVKPIALRHILEMAKNPIMKNVQKSSRNIISHPLSLCHIQTLRCLLQLSHISAKRRMPQ